MPSSLSGPRSTRTGRHSSARCQKWASMISNLIKKRFRWRERTSISFGDRSMASKRLSKEWRTTRQIRKVNRKRLRSCREVWITQSCAPSRASLQVSLSRRDPRRSQGSHLASFRRPTLREETSFSMHIFQSRQQGKFYSLVLFIFFYRTESLIMRDGEDPKMVAELFAQRFNLGESAKQTLIQ